MLDHISVETIKQVAALANRAGRAHDRFIGGMHNIDLGEQLLERGNRNPSDLDTLGVLAATGDSRELDALKEKIRALSPEARQELRAVLLIGRGDFAGNEWESALAEAARTPDASSVDDIAERLTLHGYLMKGLFEMKLS